MTKAIRAAIARKKGDTMKYTIYDTRTCTDIDTYDTLLDAITALVGRRPEFIRAGGYEPSRYTIVDEDGDGVVVMDVGAEGYRGILIVCWDPSRVILGMQDNFKVPNGGSRQMFGVEIHANILQAFMMNRLICTTFCQLMKMHI